MQSLIGLWKDESGANAIEYGLIAFLISIVIIASLTTLGNFLSTQFTNIDDAMPVDNR